MADKNSKTPPDKKLHRPEPVKKVMNAFGIKKSKSSVENPKGKDEAMTEVDTWPHKLGASSMSPVETSPEEESTFSCSTDNEELHVCNVGSCTLAKQMKEDEIQRLSSECVRNQDEICRLKEECVRYQKFADQLSKTLETSQQEAKEKLMNERRQHKQELENLRTIEIKYTEQEKESNEKIKKKMEDNNVLSQKVAQNSSEYEQKLKELNDLKRQPKMMMKQEDSALNQAHMELAELSMRYKTLQADKMNLLEEIEKLKSINETLQRENHHAATQFQKQAENEKAEVVDQLEAMKNKVSTLEKQLLERADPTAVEVQQEEYEKVKEDMAAERRHWRKAEAELLAEIEQQKQALADVQTSSKATEEMVDQLKHQLRDKDQEIQLLITSHKSPPVTHVSIQSEPDEEKRQLSQTVKAYEHELTKTRAIEETAGKAMQVLKKQIEIQKQSIKEEEKKCDEIQKKCRDLELKFELKEEELATIIQEKQTVIKELSNRLKTLSVEFDAAKYDLEAIKSELSILTHEKEHQMMASNQTISSQLSTIDELKEDLVVARSQNEINNEELAKTMKEEKKAKESINLTKKELMKAGMKSVEELRKNYEEMKEQLQQKVEEDASTAQQVKAYKKQLDDSNERLTNMKEKKDQLEERLGVLTGIETDYNIMQSKYDQLQTELRNLKSSLDTTKQDLKMQLAENKKLVVGQQAMKRKLERDLLDYQEHIRQLSQRNTQLKNEVMVLNESLSEAWAKYDALIASRINQPSTQHHKHKDQSNHPNDHYSDSMTNQADKCLKEAQEARQQFEQKRYTGQINHTPQQQITDRTSHTSYQQMTSHPSHTPQQHMPGLTNPIAQQRMTGGISHASQQQTVGLTNHTPYQQVVPHEQVISNMPVVSVHRTNDIHENPIIENIDDEIQQYANEVRRDTQPPRTQEFTSNDGQGIPYDPNLTCDGCGKQFRFGEIQKLRRHIHEFCIAREQT